jgi:PAS domain S-box-containing protein
MKKLLDIQTRLSLSFGLLFVVALVSVEYIHIWGLPYGLFHGLIDIQRSEAFRELDRIADHKKEHFKYWIRERRADIQIFAENEFVRNKVEKLMGLRDTLAATGLDKVEARIRLRQTDEYSSLKSYLLQIQETYGFYKGLHITDAATGQFLVATYDKDPAGDKFYSSPADRKLPAGNGYVEPVILGHHSNTPVIHVIYPIKDSSGSVIAVLKMGINVNEAVIPLLNTGKGLGKSGEAFLVNSRKESLGKLKYPLNSGEFARPLQDPLQSEVVERAVSGNDGIMESDDYRGEPVLAAYRFIEMTPDWGWGLIVKRDQRELYAPLRHNVVVSLVLGLAGLFIVIVLTVIFARKISNPIKSLSEAAARVAEGDLSVRASEASDKEVAILSQTFNSMVQHLQDSQSRLEQTVAKRTGELQQSNENLQNEINIRHKIEKALRESEARFRALFEFSPQAVLLTEAGDGRIIDVNNKLCESMGISKEGLVGKSTTELGCFSSEQRTIIIDEVKEKGEINGMEWEFIMPGGRKFDGLIYSRLLTLSDKPCVLTIIVDITEHKMLESKLLQSQKMEAIGTLAAGIAHDFNNILNSMFGYIEVLKRDLKENKKALSSLESIGNGGRRAASLIKQILTFSRQADQNNVPVQLQTVIDDVVGLLHGTLPASVELQQEVDSNCKEVMGDDTQLHQVVMNLCTNALQAMQEKGGVLSIELRQISISRALAENDSDLPAGEYARLRIKDTGIGIDEVTLQRIFEPYYSNRPSGEGTGLGLAMVHGIVKSHAGTIRCRSEVGRGTLFEVFIPVMKEDVTVVRQEESAPPEFKGRILYIDDEIANKQIWEIAFKHIGCQIVAETDSEKALQIFQHSPGSFDVVITDQSMPEMTGIELARQMLEIRPDLPIILATGFDNNSNKEEALKTGIKGFIKKPHSLDDLLRVIARVTDS